MLQCLEANFVNAFLAAVLAESGLSILGLGLQREMTLGMMIYWLSAMELSCETSGGDYHRFLPSCSSFSPCTWSIWASMR
jgi:hypothetical protein